MRMFFIARVSCGGQILPAACFHKWRFSWNTDTLSHLRIVYGCFCAIAAEMSSCDRDCMFHKARNILPSDPLRKKVLTRALLAFVSSRIWSRLILCLHFKFFKKGINDLYTHEHSLHVMPAGSLMECEQIWSMSTRNSIWNVTAIWLSLLFFSVTMKWACLGTREYMGQNHSLMP